MLTANLVQGAIFTMMVVRMEDPRDPDFALELGRQIALSPRFFDNAPVVLDIKGSLAFLDPSEFDEARGLLKRHKLVPVGVQNATQPQLRAAQAAGLCSFNASSPGRKVEGAPAPQRGSAAIVATPPSGQGGRSKIVTRPVRSGAQIYARGADLIVIAPVSPGAELIADGHIHVYGTLRGRAIAGAQGDAEARIFCNRLEAELVSVAGRYLVSENIPADVVGQPVQISLDEDRLAIVRTAA